MAKFAETYPDREFVQTVSAQIPWSHNIAILEKVKDPQQRIWYIEKTAENGWSHNVLIHQINPSIGLLLCKSKNNVVAEYSLKDISKPIGVSEYKITSSLPDDLEKQLPSVEDIQKRIKYVVF